MRTQIVFSFIAAAALLGRAQLYSAETNSALPTPDVTVSTNSPSSHEEAEKSLTLLVARIKAKLQMGKQDEADYADIFKDFDTLLARYQKPSDDRFNILFEEARLYLAGLGKPAKALPLFEELKKEYPDLVINDNTDLFLAQLKEEIDVKRIQEAMAPGTAFPDFNEKDLQGNPLSVAKFKGKVVLVDFWATWCPYCLIEMPDLQKTYKEYHNKGFEIVGISMDEDMDALQKYIKTKKIPWPQYFQGQRFDGKLSMKYAIEAAPTKILIDREGKIIKRLSPEDDVTKEIAEAMKKS